MANFYGAIALIGGGAGALDNLVDVNGDPIGGDGLNDGDGAVVITSSGIYVYSLDATSGLSESSPDVIAPDVTPGAKRWILQSQAGESYKNIRSYGAVGDGVADDTAAFQAAVTAAADNLLFFPAGTYLIVGDVTVPASVELWFANGAMLEVDSGDTVTINGHIRDVVHQIFSGSGAVAGALRNDFVRPEWWGAVDDGSTPSADAVDAAIEHAQSSGVKTVQFLSGSYVVESALGTYTAYHGLVLLGAASHYYGTTFVFTNIAVDTDALRFGNCDWLRIENIRFTTSGTQARSGLCLGWSCSNGRFVNVRTDNFTLAGIYLDSTGGSVFYNQFMNCQSYGSQYGVFQKNGSCNSIQFIGGRYANNDIAGICMRGQNHQFMGVDLESSPTGLTTANGDPYTSRGWLIQNCYFENMDSNPVIALSTVNYSIIGPNFVSSGPNELWFHGDNEYNVVINWYGDITLNPAAAANSMNNNVFINMTGTLSDNGVDNLDIKTGLVRADGSVPLTDDWDAGEYYIAAKELLAVNLAAVSPVLGDTVVTNHKFTVDTSGWTALRATLTSEAGGQDGNCLKIENTTITTGFAQQWIAVQKGSWYDISFYFKFGDRASRFAIGTTQYGQEVLYLDSTQVVWTERTVRFLAPADTLSVWMFIASGQIGYYSLYDEINIQRVNEGDLVVGASLAAGTEFSLDGDRVSMPNLKSGANQVASGAVAGEVWWDTGDNTLKMGI